MIAKPADTARSASKTTRRARLTTSPRHAASAGTSIDRNPLNTACLAHLCGLFRLVHTAARASASKGEDKMDEIGLPLGYVLEYSANFEKHEPWRYRLYYLNQKIAEGITPKELISNVEGIVKSHLSAIIVFERQIRNAESKRVICGNCKHLSKDPSTFQGLHYPCMCPLPLGREANDYVCTLDRPASACKCFERRQS